MKPMMPDSAQRSELRCFGDMLKACSPPREVCPEDPARQIAEIEQRAASITTHRTWLAVATAGVLLAGLVGLGMQRTELPSAVAPIASERKARRDRASLHNATNVSKLVDLGIARLLLRPGCTASYDRIGRALHLEAGAVVAHVLPNGRGFRVELARQTVVVKGTLFGVDAARGKVEVWHGVVEHRDRRGGYERIRRIAGMEVFGDLTSEELRQLAFALPEAVAPTQAVLPATVQRPRPKRRRRTRLANRPKSIVAAAAAGVAADAEPDKVSSADPPKPAEPDPERQLLLRAQRRLARGLLSDALATLQRHARQYPSSELAEEASLLRIRAMLSLQRSDLLRAEVAQFLRRFPASAMAGQVRRLGEKLSQKK